MPTVLYIKGYRFFFFSNENDEPMHIHVEKAECYAKFWLKPVYIACNYGFIGKELREIGNLIEQNEQIIKDKWNEHFGQR